MVSFMNDSGIGTRAGRARRPGIKYAIPALVMFFLAFALGPKLAAEPLESSVVENGEAFDLSRLGWRAAPLEDSENATAIARAYSLDDGAAQTPPPDRFVSVAAFPIRMNRLFPTDVGPELRDFLLTTSFSINATATERLRQPALLLPGIGEGWSVFLNGVQIGSSTGEGSAQGLTPRYMRNLVLPFDRDVLNETNRLVIHLRGYAPATPLADNFLFGLTVNRGYLLGSENALKASTEQYGEITLYGVYIFFGLYHIFLFLHRRKERYNLFFGLFSIVLALYLLAFTNRAFQMVENSAYLILIAYPAQPLALALFLLFLESYFYPDRPMPRILIGGLAANLSVAAFLLISPYRFAQSGLIFWYLLAAPQILYLLAFIAGTIRRRLPDARKLAMALVMGLALMVWDILDTVLFRTQIRLIQFGHLTIIMVLVGLLARRFVRVYNQSEELAANLDSKVSERTLELQKAWQKLESAYRQAEGSRKEIEKLSEFSRLLNETTNYEEVVLRIFEYIEVTFDIEGIWLLRVDRPTQEFYLTRVSAASLEHYDDETIAFFRNTRFKLDESAGTIYHVYQKKKPLFLRRIRLDRASQPFDRLVVERLGLESALDVPLVIHGDVTGVVIFTRYQRSLNLSRGDIGTITRFCAQVAGVLHTASLFQQVEREREKSDRLLYNILPDAIADELKEKGQVRPRKHEDVTILFTDFKSFTSEAEQMPVEELVEDLDAVFEQFDRVCARYGIDKLKTIGDSYMAAGGLTVVNHTHPVDVVLAAMDIMDFVTQVNEIRREITGGKFWTMRIGVHTGPVISGVIGRARFAYDIWGDAVNLASRMETAGTPGLINISQKSYDRVKYFFDCEYRGRIPVKNRGQENMYYVKGIRASLSKTQPGRVPDDDFRRLYDRLHSGARLRFKSESSASGAGS